MRDKGYGMGVHVPHLASPGTGYTFREAKSNALMDAVGTWFGYLFWVIGATSLFAAALGIVDSTCRLGADVLKVSYLRDNET